MKNKMSNLKALPMVLFLSVILSGCKDHEKAFAWGEVGLYLEYPFNTDYADPEFEDESRAGEIYKNPKRLAFIRKYAEEKK